MPCWSTQSNEVSLEGMTGDKLKLLREALVSLGYYIHGKNYAGFEGSLLVADHFANRTSVVVAADGKVTTSMASGGEALALASAKVKKAYAATVVAAALKKFGWQSTKNAAGVIHATRRY